LKDHVESSFLILVLLKVSRNTVGIASIVRKKHFERDAILYVHTRTCHSDSKDILLKSPTY